jgi:restriction endonuclease S subunit
VIGSGLNLEGISFIDDSRFEEFERFEIKKGDILMSLTGNIGRVIKVGDLPFKVIQNYRVGKFIPFDLQILSREFTKHLLMSDAVFGRFGQLSNQSAQANFGKQDMDKIHVTIPNIEEQQKSLPTYRVSIPK